MKQLDELMNDLLIESKPITEPLLIDWLEQDSQKEGVQFLLAHTVSGIVWGKCDGQNWSFSNDNPIDRKHLLEMRLFGENKEILVWKSHDNFMARQLIDDGSQNLDRLEESQILWGTWLADQTGVPAGFTLVEDGQQGLQHAVPLEFAIVSAKFPTSESENKDGSKRPLRLHLVHYLAQDKESGLARIVLSRLKTIDTNTSQDGLFGSWGKE